MTIEQQIVDLLNPMFNEQVFWVTTPDGYFSNADFVILSSMGGDEYWYQDNSVPDHKNMTLRVRTFSRDPQQAMNNGRAVARALAGSGITCRPEGAVTSIYDEGGKYHGTLQHFGVWYPDP